jgi:hypothetical protein
MAEILFYPLDIIKPSQLLSQYSEWIYFGLILVFFISISGITLRKHFDQPYVKPLIIAVGLMLTVGVFMAKKQLAMIFEGWGTLGLILLFFVVATIPYGLCRGFGMPGIKAFYLTYILFYVLSWFKLPAFFFSLAKHNLGLVNLGLLIIFFVSIFKMIPLSGSKKKITRDLVDNNSFGHEIARSIRLQKNEKKIVEKKAVKITKLEIRTIEDMTECLAEIQRIVETNKNNLTREEREKIATLLRKVLDKKDIFKRGLLNLKKIYQHIGSIGTKELQKLKDRMANTPEKERQILKLEIEREEEKLKYGMTIQEYEKLLDRWMNSFNEHIESSVLYMKGTLYYQKVKDYLAESRLILVNISDLIKKIKILEEKLINITEEEKKLMNKEKEIA